MDDDALTGDILPPEAPRHKAAAASLAMARRLALGAPSADLQGLLQGRAGHLGAEPP